MKRAICLERAKDLHDAYFSIIKQDQKPMERFELAVNSKAPRLYIESPRAHRLVVKYLKNKTNPKAGTRDHALMEAYHRATKENPENTLDENIQIAIEYEAPSFFITPKSAKIIILKYRKNANHNRIYSRK